jgi:hypothetical protein
VGSGASGLSNIGPHPPASSATPKTMILMPRIYVGVGLLSSRL